MTEKQEIIIAKTESDKIVEKIEKQLQTTEKSYLNIVPLIAKMKDTKGYLNYESKSISEFCAKRFGMSKSTTSTLLKIFSKCFDKDTYKMLEVFDGLGFAKLSQLVRLDNPEELAESGKEKNVKELKQEIDVKCGKVSVKKDESSINELSETITVQHTLFQHIIDMLNEEFDNVTDNVTTIIIKRED